MLSKQNHIFILALVTLKHTTLLLKFCTRKPPSNRNLLWAVLQSRTTILYILSKFLDLQTQKQVREARQLACCHNLRAGLGLSPACRPVGHMLLHSPVSLLPPLGLNQ